MSAAAAAAYLNACVAWDGWGLLAEFSSKAKVLTGLACSQRETGAAPAADSKGGQATQEPPQAASHQWGERRDSTPLMLCINVQRFRRQGPSLSGGGAPLLCKQQAPRVEPWQHLPVGQSSHPPAPVLDGGRDSLQLAPPAGNKGSSVALPLSPGAFTVLLEKMAECDGAPDLAPPLHVGCRICQAEAALKGEDGL